MKAHTVFVNLHKYGITPCYFTESSAIEVEDGSVTIDDKLYIQVCAYGSEMLLQRWEIDSKTTRTITTTTNIATLARHIKKERASYRFQK